MPSYDLKCEDCGYQFSVFCSISAKDQQKCPQCDTSKLSQRFTSVNIGGSRSSDAGGSGRARSGFS